MAYASFTVRDKGGELSRTGLTITEPDGGDLVSGLTSQLSAIQTVIEGVSLGVVARSQFSLGATVDADFPASDLAQREHALRIFYHGDTYGEKGNITIPCVDIASLTLSPNSDLVLLADAGPMAALVTQFELYGAIIANGNEDTITVDKALIVGRNS